MTSRRPVVALVTCADLPDLDPDDRLLLPALTQAGLEVVVAVWDDPSVDWAGFDLAVVRNTWDYTRRRDQFVAWARSVPRLANPAEVVAWNTDKRYLAQLAAAGVPTVPTTWVDPGQAWSPPAEGEWVVKPTVSAGSIDTNRYVLPAQQSLAAAHVDRLHAAGRAVMVQPYVSSVDSYGETALLYFGGAYSHAIRKGPMLPRPDLAATTPSPDLAATTPSVELGEDALFVPEQITPRTPTEAERAVADATLRALPFDPAGLLYARVDLLDSGSGPIVIEVELTEPSLFVGTSPGAPDRFAAAVAAHLPRR